MGMCGHVFYHCLILLEDTYLAEVWFLSISAWERVFFSAGEWWGQAQGQGGDSRGRIRHLISAEKTQHESDLASKLPCQPLHAAINSCSSLSWCDEHVSSTLSGVNLLLSALFFSPQHRLVYLLCCFPSFLFHTLDWLCAFNTDTEKYGSLNLSTQKTVGRLQLIQNDAARVLPGGEKTKWTYYSCTCIISMASLKYRID